MNQDIYYTDDKVIESALDMMVPKLRVPFKIEISYIDWQKSILSEIFAEEERDYDSRKNCK